MLSLLKKLIAAILRLLRIRKDVAAIKSVEAEVVAEPAKVEAAVVAPVKADVAAVEADVKKDV